MTLEEALVYTAEAMGARLSAPAIEMMVSDLAGYPEVDILAALKRCRAECKGRLALADILERMPGRPPTADEAWEQALKAELWNEDATIIVPNAILRAFPFAMWRQGDKIGARRAFIDAYRREAAQPDAFDLHVSDGFDAENRAAVTREAIEAGLLEDQSARRLPKPEGDDMPPEERARRLGDLAKELRRRARDHVAARRRAPPEPSAEVVAQSLRRCLDRVDAQEAGKA